jgi:hypothetical protein
MIVLFLVTLVCTTLLLAIGIPIARYFDFNGALAPAAGLAFYIFGTQLFSSVLNLSVPNSSILVCCISLSLLLYNPGRRNLQISKFNISIILLYLVTVFTFSILAELAMKDFGLNNFDFIYATQDARFLQTHSVMESTEGLNIIPSDWSAIAGSRYAISFLVSFLSFSLPSISILVLSQAVLLSCFLIGFISLILFVRSVSQFNWKLSVAVALIASFTSLNFLQINSQMFGQISAAPLVHLIFLFSVKPRKSIRDITGMSCAFYAIFLMYPAVTFPLILYIALIAFLFRNEALFKLNKKYFIWGSIHLLILLGLYSGNPKWPFQSAFFWISPLASGASSQEGMASQFISAIGPGQFIGAIPYPFTSGYSLWVLLLSCVSVSFLVIQLLLIFRSKIYMNRIHLGVFLISFYIFAIYAILKGNTYGLLKVATWLQTLLFSISLIACIIAVRLVLKQFFRSFYPVVHISKFSLIFLVATLIVLSANFSTTWRYLETSDVNTSFPQSITKEQSLALHKLQLQPTNVYGIVAPTLEESIWISESFPSEFQKLFVQIGPQAQARDEITKRVCPDSNLLNQVRKANMFLLNRRIKDIVPGMKFEKEIDLPSVGQFGLGSIKNLDQALLVSGGLFPPTFRWQVENFPFFESDLLRWSSGSACFIAYTKYPKQISLTFPYILGPDIPPRFQWKASGLLSQNDELSNFGEIQVRQNLNSGWNFIWVKAVPTQVIEVDKENWLFKRADSRELWFALGKGSINIITN